MRAGRAGAAAAYVWFYRPESLPREWRRENPRSREYAPAVYRWRDAAGVLQLTDTPPKDRPYETGACRPQYQHRARHPAAQLKALPVAGKGWDAESPSPLTGEGLGLGWLLILLRFHQHTARTAHCHLFHHPHPPGLQSPAPRPANTPMRLSQFHLSTAKETPADAEIVSQLLMLRAGMVRKLAAGLYTWSPLGLRGAAWKPWCARKWTAPAPSNC